MTTRFLPLDQSDPVEIAGYALRARLGSGGMGNVYLSFTRGGRPVALKVVRQEFAADPEFRRRFRMEVTAAQRVQGLYTAPVVDADAAAPVPWLATAYIAGPALNQAVVDYGPFPEPSLYRLLGGVAEGLTAIHAAGLVHRDLKPANVLLAPDGPRVIDFGIAHAADASAMTGTGAIMGTPAYMAPEQVTGKPVSAGTDVFALAHLVAYAATGHTVFGDGHFAALVYRIANEEPDLTGCPESLREVLVCCLAKDPAARPALNDIIGYARERLTGQTMQLAGSWLPQPVAGTLAAYDTSALPPAPQRLEPVPVAAGGVMGGAAGAGAYGPAAGPYSPTATSGLGGPAGPTGSGGYYSPPPTLDPRPQGPVRPPRRGLRRPRVILPAVLIVLLAVAGGGGYLGFKLHGNSSKEQAGTGTVPKRTASSAPAVTPSAVVSSSVAPSAVSSVTASAPAALGAATPSAAGTAAVNDSTQYSTPEPFPLCDPGGGQWLLVNLTPQSGGCAPNMQGDVNSAGYAFGTVTSFPDNVPALSASNTVTVSGQIPDDYYTPQCLGAAEGGSTGGYMTLLCDNGQWYINQVVNLGTSGAVVGKQLATGSFPFDSSTTYDVSLTFGSGKAKMTVDFSQGSASPLSETFKTGDFTPDAIGYALQNAGSGNTATIAGFTYTKN
jgi:hypothetical protein